MRSFLQVEQLKSHFVDPASGDGVVPVGDCRDPLVPTQQRIVILTLSAETSQELDVQSALGVFLALNKRTDDLSVVGVNFVRHLAELLNVGVKRRADGQELHGDLVGLLALGGSTGRNVVDRAQVGDGDVRVVGGLSV